MASYVFSSTDSDRDSFTALFENTPYYTGSDGNAGKPGAKVPFYFDGKLNFGYGYNLTDNSTTFAAELKADGVSDTAITRAQEYINGTNDKTLGHTPSIAEINAALDSKTDYRPAALKAEDAFYTTNNSSLDSYLSSKYKFNLNSLPLGPKALEGVKLVTQDFAYNGGVATAAIGGNYRSDLQAGDLGSAAWEVAYNTASASTSLPGYEIRLLANTVRLFGLTVTIGSDNLHVTDISGTPDDVKSIQKFLTKHTDNFTHDNSLVTWGSLSGGGTDFQKAMDTYTVGQGYFVAYGDASHLDATPINLTTNTLQMFDSQFYGGVLSGFTAGKTLDLTGIGTASKATIGANNVMSVTKSDGSILTIKLDPGASYSGMTPNVAADNNGGTNITLGGKEDIAFVIDTTGSMTPYISAVQADATNLINAAFNGGTTNTQIGVVSFADPQAGYPDAVTLPFTTQANFADRQTAAVNAINSLTASGGGDIPEGDYSGLLLALNGSMGAWRQNAAVHRIVLFTDAPVKDSDLAAQVNQYAANIGLNPAALTGDPPGDPAVQVQIYTVQVGNDSTATASIQEIATNNRGEFFAASTPDDLTATLMKIINSPGTVTTSPVADVSPELQLLYGTILGRGADEEGLVHYTDLIEKGSYSLLQVASEMISSPEFLASHGILNNDALLNVLGTNSYGSAPGGGSAGDAELQGATISLQGGLSPSEVAVAIALNPTHQAASGLLLPDGVVVPQITGSFITNSGSAGGQGYLLTHVVLGSAATQLDLEDAAALVRSGASATDVAGHLLASASYTSLYGSQSDTQFLDQIYQNAFDRSPDPDGLVHYADELAGGVSRAAVVSDIAFSAEHIADTHSAFDSGLYIPSADGSALARLYQGILGRGPDLLGFEHYSDALSGGTLGQVASEFVGSAEFSARNGSEDNSSFVRTLYENALGRDPETDGLNHYLAQLGSGISRGAVALDITQSPEARLHLAPQIENGLHIT